VVYTDGKMLPPLPWGRKFGLEESEFKDELYDKNSRRLPISELKRLKRTPWDCRPLSCLYHGIG